MDEFTKQQRMLICAELGHSWAMPTHSELRIEGDKCELLCVCTTCQNESWQEIRPEMREAFLRYIVGEAKIVSFMKG